MGSKRYRVGRWPAGKADRGLTLTELTIIGILATIVMLALTGFYFGSQQLWIDGSTQAMTQRDATLLVETLRARVHGADTALVAQGKPDANHDELTLGYAHSDTSLTFRYDDGDGRLHLYVNGVDDQGPVVPSMVRVFRVLADTTLVDLTELDVRSVNGDIVQMSSRFGILGKGL